MGGHSGEVVGGAIDGGEAGPTPGGQAVVVTRLGWWCMHAWGG